MRKHTRWIWLGLAYVAFQACEGSSGCGDGCVEPIPGGFPLDKRVENSVQARLTPNAITFLEANYAALLEMFMPDGLTFPIETSESDLAGIGTVTICACGDCSATASVVGFDIQTVAPASILLVAQVQVVTTNLCLAIAPGLLCLCWDDCECDIDLDTRRTDPTFNTLTMTAEFSIDARTGYTAVNVTNAALADEIQSDDIDITNGNFCGLAICTLAGLPGIKDLIVGTLQDQIASMLSGQFDTLTCMACPDTGCPEGSDCDGDYCRYRGDGTCVPMLLGMEGRTDLGALMASVSPGMSAPVQFVAAAGGYANVNGDGLNLGMFGGMEAETRSACVPATYTADWLNYDPAPLAPEFSSGTDFTGCRRCPTGTECSAGYTCSATGRCDDAGGTCETVTQSVMAKIGVAERFLNRAGAGMFESGALCLALGTSLVEQLNSGMLALLMPALDKLTWGTPSPVAIEVRPQLPPRFEIAEEPLLTVRLDQAQMDFYVWMLERYVKILTVQMDLVVGLRLDASAGQIVPAVASIVAENVNVTDAEIVGPPGNINELFTDLMDLIAGMIPPFEPIALPEFSGFVLEVPDGGIMHVASGGEDFLALFANLALAPTPPGPHLDTSARLTSLRSPADDLAGPPPGRLRDLVPTALVDASAVRPTASPRQTDYRWRVDGGAWSSWTRDPRLVVRSPFLLFAGDHVVEVQSRLADDDSTIDPAPARVPVHIDGVPGAIAGRRTHEQGAAPSRALRGRPSADSGSSACSCTVPGAGAPGSLGLLGLALGAVVLLRRRRLLPALVLGAALAGLGAGGGCDCGKGSGNGGDDGGGDADTPTGCTDDSCAPGRCCPATGQCVELPSEDGFCEPGFECVDEDGDFAPTFDVAACAFTTDCCAEMEPLPEGFVGQHSEVAVTSSGAIWVAGYSAGASERSTYGDLVAGTWNAATTSVDWVHVDGVPADGEIEGGPSGWRGGVAEPGDDVGKYATIAIGIDGEPRVAYYDATNGALKYAAHAAAGWTVRAQPIDDTGDAGRYADMVIGTDGRPVVSYNAIEESADTPGAYVSKIKVAWADDGGGASWTIYEGLDTVPIPCWAALCGEERVCLASTRTCATPEDESLCGEGCDTGQECVAGVCEDVFDAPIDFPEGVGIVTGIDLLPDGTPVVVYYDRGAWDAAEGEVRPHGDLKLAVYNGGTWIVSTLDGGTTDAGWYPSLDIDASGQRHVAYVDGISEDLIYLNVDTAVREVVDGRSVPGGARHIVGDDSSIRVGADGTIWIAYQDATAGILRLARRTGTAAWEIRDVDTQDTTGFFACLVLGVSGPGTPVVSTYWHRTTASGGTTTRYSYAAGVRVFQVTP